MSALLDDLRSRICTANTNGLLPESIDLIDETGMLQIRGGDNEYSPSDPAEGNSLHERWSLPAFLINFTR